MDIGEPRRTHEIPIPEPVPDYPPEPALPEPAEPAPKREKEPVAP